MSVDSKRLAQGKARRERKRQNRALRALAEGRPPVEPIIGLTGGQNPDTPHRSFRIEVFYVADGNHFFVSPSRAQASAPGHLVRTTTMSAAEHKGLSWDKEDRGVYEAQLADRRAALEELYTVDSSTGARLRRDK